MIPSGTGSYETPPPPYYEFPTPHHMKEQPTEDRAARAALAEQTLEAIGNEIYTTPDGDEYRISKANKTLRASTRYYAPTYETKEAAVVASTSAVPVVFRERSTVAAAREWASPYARVGVLNFASPVRPGGWFRTGAQAQEESLARASNLFHSPSQTSVAPFYESHQADDHGGFYSRAMIYSGDAILIRDGNDELAPPITVDILTCAAVDAGLVQQRRSSAPDQEIYAAMHDRMNRILQLFAERGAKVLILGAFGTGAFKNSIENVATIWAELLGHGGCLQRTFDRVEFAILGASTYRTFRDTYEQVIQRQLRGFEDAYPR